MSIATLKRKTQTQYHNMSVGAPGGFSLNGTHRNQGFVGQTTLSRTLVRTLARGPTLKGHGGCCGTYPITNIVTSPDMSSLEDSRVVKSSSLNNNGLLMTKYRWIRRPRPFTELKIDSNHMKHQGYYIDRVARLAVEPCKDANGVDIKDKDKPVLLEKCTSCNPAGDDTTTGKSYRSLFYKTSRIFKPDAATGAISSSEYLRKINTKCAGFETYTFTNSSRAAPFACSNSSK